VTIVETRPAAGQAGVGKAGVQGSRCYGERSLMTEVKRTVFRKQTLFRNQNVRLPGQSAAHRGPGEARTSGSVPGCHRSPRIAGSRAGVAVDGLRSQRRPDRRMARRPVQGRDDAAERASTALVSSTSSASARLIAPEGLPVAAIDPQSQPGPAERRISSRNAAATRQLASVRADSRWPLDFAFTAGFPAAGPGRQPPPGRDLRRWLGLGQAGPRSATRPPGDESRPSPAEPWP